MFRRFACFHTYPQYEFHNYSESISATPLACRPAYCWKFIRQNSGLCRANTTTSDTYGSGTSASNPGHVITMGDTSFGTPGSLPALPIRTVVSAAQVMRVMQRKERSFIAVSSGSRLAATVSSLAARTALVAVSFSSSGLALSVVDLLREYDDDKDEQLNVAFCALFPAVQKRNPWAGSHVSEEDEHAETSAANLREEEELLIDEEIVISQDLIFYALSELTDDMDIVGGDNEMRYAGGILEEVFENLQGSQNEEVLED
ncbi:hypothetical protein KIN20_024352 [Parelaphostrongylus tenuis]|uniref:Uncharacterized protein n=1 Tax=Parelaphostrongylus tenuis TaxID=148309 RepID=A0AAD5N9X5_PARTN|nr:hypothetical protein KIN20_024352 [Parelaphostrongylus tenuis]